MACKDTYICIQVSHLGDLSISIMEFRQTVKLSIPRLISTVEMMRLVEGGSACIVAAALGCTWDEIEMDEQALRRMVSVFLETDSCMVYSDYDEIKEGTGRVCHPVTDYQFGSVRDDFDFGAVVVFHSQDAAEFLRIIESELPGLKYGAFYAFRLAMSRFGTFIHVRERLYTKKEKDLRISGVKQFDYVNPANRDVQVEMERVFTHYLKEENVYLPEVSGRVEFTPSESKMVASVIIPVKNRVRTIADAVRSALSQKTDFPFNVLVVDNHSDDGTSDVLSKAAAADPRLVHIVPERGDLMIGGCWNRAVFDSHAGTYAVQLDSDDVYSREDALQIIVDKLRKESLAMVIGSYQLTDFDLNPIPPGVIDHKEWTDGNGFNNALRINGLGAPRAFNVNVLRQTGGFPNVSYGEDYAVGLRITREYRLGRIYEVLYDCRRWSGNSDSSLSQEKINRNNEYKDMLRTLEMTARRNMMEDFEYDE